jgi:hypothetical protein
VLLFLRLNVLLGGTACGKIACSSSWKGGFLFTIKDGFWQNLLHGLILYPFPRALPLKNNCRGEHSGKYEFLREGPGMG